MTHLYVSSDCLHSQHDQCRKRCAVCGTACLCPCHPRELSALIAQVARIENQLDVLQQQRATMSGRIDDITTLLTAVDEATNAVAAEIDALKAEIAGGLTTADAQVVVDRLTAASDKLKALAADPANPVPEG